MPMGRTRLLLILAAFVVAVGIGGFLVYDQILRGDSTAALSLPGASTPPGSALPAASFDGVVAGTWSVAGGSQAGYRVREQLANLPAQSDAVGRTDKVTGSITLATSGATTTLTAGSLSVDTTSITSDKSMRDTRLRTQGLETDAFPTATFKLAKPVQVPAAALSGTATAITLTGDLTLHGVTRRVDIPAQAQLVGGRIQVAGSIAFPLSDYSIVAPNVGGTIISIADTGALEFLVTFTKS
jgi:polyisoprenoid-binding protein YceI